MIIKINVSLAPNQHIRMISEGSCDAEDWGNDAENSALHHRNKLQFTIYSHKKGILYCNNIAHYYYFYCILSIRDFFQKHTDPKNRTVVCVCIYIYMYIYICIVFLCF